MSRGRFPLRVLGSFLITFLCLALALPAPAAATVSCKQTVFARVVSLDSALPSNRLGSTLPDGMIFALAGDVEPTDGANPADWTTWNAGKVALKSYKRPRPVVLRVAKGECLTVQFRNLVAATAQGNQTSTRATSVHLQGLNWTSSQQDDGSWVGGTAGQNTSSLSNPGDPVRSYTLFAVQEGPFLLYSTADTLSFVGGDPGSAGGNGGSLQLGLFGAVVVEPQQAEFYRSQVNHEDLCLASTDHVWSGSACSRPNPDKLPKINYQSVYPAGHPRAGLTVLNMIQKTSLGNELVHSDLTAIITGPRAGRFPAAEAALPGFHDIAVSPDRLQPFREFTLIYHEMFTNQQAFSQLYASSQLNKLFEATNDNFAINYGMGGIGSEILANRFGVGPMGQCTDCKYEEFFLSSWSNGDPAMIVDKNADNGCQESTSGDYTTYACPGHQPATKAYYPDDPSNVYHAYLQDHTKFRILHGGSNLHHIHHLHAHQWLHSPDSSSSSYLDSQAIGPGSAFTLETVYNGGGNKNLTVGDSIFHCHFYPHFAAGMWSLWRVHDTFEDGTELAGYPQGKPLPNSRALPDGEITTGTPTPAVVPLPTKAMAPEPAPVKLVDSGKQVEVCTDHTFTTCVSSLAATTTVKGLKNPGYPFFIASTGGSRAAHPPLDFALACSTTGEPCGTAGAACGVGGVCSALDGGLPRHVVATGGTAHAAPLNPLDFSKEVEKATGIEVPEDGTAVEKVAMAFHAVRLHPSVTPAGAPKTFLANGHKPIAGAPYAEPCINIQGHVPPGLHQRDYWAADFQTAARFNKEGWHYPQQRMISLWGDVADFMGLDGKAQRPPEPFFFRANSNDCVHYVLANLVPKTYELDDFQVRTPTDILGQHIHLVKFDVTSSDGAANGWNYEDGTLAPDEVTERIDAFNKGSWVPSPGGPAAPLKPKFIKFFGADPDCPQGKSGQPGEPLKCQCRLAGSDVQGGRWCGSQATVQRWYVDPTLNDAREDQTLRTVFTHDHFGPSTHQQTGVYAALVAEPHGSHWLDNQTGTPLGGRTASSNGVSLPDGGPTSWEAVIRTGQLSATYREFVLAFQDSTLMYLPFPDSVKAPACPASAGGLACGFCSTDPTKACVTDPSSPLYYGTVCPAAVKLPIAGTSFNSQLQASCNFIPGIPSRNSLFFGVSGSTTANIWGLAPGAPLAALQALGWDTLPIDPAPNGLFVSGQQKTAAQPEGITLDGATTNFSFNYRNEPIFPRIYSSTGAPTAQDLSYVYRSEARTLPGETAAPPYTKPLTPGVQPEDPFTPLLRAYAGDDVQVRIVVGAHQNPHNFNLNDMKWLFEPSNVNSGWRNTQTMGISEHFEFLLQVPPALSQPNPQTPYKPWRDYLYRSTAARKGQASGNWGLFRAYDQKQPDLFPLPGAPAHQPIPVCPAKLMNVDCGTKVGLHTLQCYTVIATSAADVFASSGKPLTYNTKLNLTTQNAILYLLKKDYDAIKAGQFAPGFDVATGQAEPMVLRAAAGDCIKVNLVNKLSSATTMGGGANANQLPVAGTSAANRDLFAASKVSQNVGLHPQLVSFDVAQSDADNVGWNPVQTAPPGGKMTYYWYAGNIDPKRAEPHVPVEFGAANLLPSDVMNHHGYGMFAGLVVEPEGATWKTDPASGDSATVTLADKKTTFREFVLFLQDDTAGSGFGGFNLKSELLNPFATLARTCTAAQGVSCVLSNAAVCNGGACGYSPDVPIQTPLFCAQKGQQARIRLLHPGGAVTNNVFELYGHSFAEEPYSTKPASCAAPMTRPNLEAGQVIAADRNQCPDGNLALGPTVSEWKGSRMGHGPTNHYDLVIASAGGAGHVPGDYLYRSFPADRFSAGIWGIFRVTDGDPAKNPKVCPTFYQP